MYDYRVIWFTTLVFVFSMGTLIPANADVISISFKPTVKFNSCNSNRNNRLYCYIPKEIGKFKLPKMGGLRIDACVYGTGWDTSNPKRCDAHRLEIIANDFCKSKGYEKSILIAKGLHEGRHATLTFKKGKSKNSYWKRREGHTVIDNIYCE